MDNGNKKKLEQLGIPGGTASNRLRKAIIFKLLKDKKENICFQCKEEISNLEDLSIEHKIPWMDSENPKDLFFDLDNIAFSHLKCNLAAARPKKINHPSLMSYNRGCRCVGCTKLNTEKQRRQRNKYSPLAH